MKPGARPTKPSMRVLTYFECAEWCAKRGFPTRQYEGCHASPDFDTAAIEAGPFHLLRFDVQKDVDQLVSEARQLYSLMGPEPEVLLWFGDWGVWSYSQHMPLLTRFRKGLAEDRPLIEAPGHLLAADDADDAISMVVMALLFSWNCHLLAASGRDAVTVSHDDWGWFASRDRARADSVRDSHPRFFKSDAV